MDEAGTNHWDENKRHREKLNEWEEEGSTLSLSTFTYCVYTINFNYFFLSLHLLQWLHWDKCRRNLPFCRICVCVLSVALLMGWHGLYTFKYTVALKCGSQSVEHYNLWEKMRIKAKNPFFSQRKNWIGPATHTFTLQKLYTHCVYFNGFFGAHHSGIVKRHNFMPNYYNEYEQLFTVHLESFTFCNIPKWIMLLFLFNGKINRNVRGCCN